ncbi:hypothetical protein QQX98_002157 [Neonectria punicea]|uniref:F-box domain-containing protein n=1 Tax=Neonectria punicea TaxID=979145 RepID=A0ABR1HL67_9HYPO
MKKITRLLSRLHPSRRHSSQLHVSPAPDSAASSPANRITKAGSANKLYISKFEQLPFDIRHQVLLAVDNIEDLGTLVRASPTYHQQYLHGRAFWLRRYLLLNIGHVLIDAYSANLCSSPSLRQRRNRQQVREFLAAYPSRRSTATVETLFASTSTEEIASIASFYTSTIRPLLQEYVAWTRSNLGSLSVPDQLSKAEQTRILRGMYRFQIFCNVFGYSRVDRDLTLSNDETLGLFLNIFEPWEFEEIICINSFADSRFQTVFDEVELDLHPDNPRFDAERRDLSTPDGAFDLSRKIHLPSI